MIIVNTDNMRIVGGMNTKSISFDVDDIPVEVDFEENIITGTGTTAVACKKYGCKCIGSELSEERLK